ncbi:MAG: hypothetical protein WDN30_14200 [Pararobbsia sp.]
MSEMDDGDEVRGLGDRAGDTPPQEEDPLLGTPQLAEMINLMANEGYSVDGVLEELVRLKGTAARGPHTVRSMNLQVDSFKAASASTLAARYEREAHKRSRR